MKCVHLFPEGACPFCAAKLPGVFTQAANLARSAAQHVAAGAPQTPPEELARREAVCRACDKFVNGRCAVCGCYTRVKASWHEQTCPHPEGNKWALPVVPEPVVPEPVLPVGVVIGSYNLPGLIELQVKLIRQHNGDSPILIVDDCSDGYGHTPNPQSVHGRLRRIAAGYPNVLLFVHPTRFGHASGDLSKVWTGLQWAKVRGLKVLAALSQRFVIDVPGWLQRGAKELALSGLATASQPCREGGATFPIRSEAMLLDVDRWHTPAILDHLMPRQMTPRAGEWGVAGEIVIADDIKDRLDGRFHHWSLFGPDRGVPYPGTVWHCSHSEAAYRALAERHGVALDAHFSCNGWRALEGAKYKG